MLIANLETKTERKTPRDKPVASRYYCRTLCPSGEHEAPQGKPVVSGRVLTQALCLTESSFFKFFIEAAPRRGARHSLAMIIIRGLTVRQSLTALCGGRAATSW
jgi:hypothetical protein